MKEIRKKLTRLKAVCLMSEPQFSDKIITTLVEGTETKQGQLDPLGKELKEGPSLYPNLIRYNAKQLASCFKGS